MHDLPISSPTRSHPPSFRPKNAGDADRDGGYRTFQMGGREEVPSSSPTDRSPERRSSATDHRHVPSPPPRRTNAHCTHLPPFPRCLHLQDQLRERRRHLVRVAERACRVRSGASGSRGVPTLRNRRAGPYAGVADARAPARGVVAARVRRPSSHPTHFWFTPAARCQRGVAFAQRT